MEIKLTLSNTQHKDLVSYCNLNNLLISDVVSKSFSVGFNIERYGLLNSEKIIEEKVIEKEVIKIQYVEIEKPIEVIKEIFIEKEPQIDLQSKIDTLQTTIQKLKQDNIEKDKKIKEYEKTIQDIQNFQESKKAMFLRGSNLEDNLYK